MNWKNIINLETLTYKPDQMGESYRYQSAPLATEMGAKKLGFHAEKLEPKSFSCPYHFHHSEEELFLVLEGEATLRQANQYRIVKKGDLIFFPNCPEGAHQFYNHTNQPFKFFALSTMDPLEVCEYPDSKKVMVAKLKKVFQFDKEVEYLRDEENPARFWPKERL